MKPPKHTIILSGGPHDGEVLAGMTGHVIIPNYSRDRVDEQGRVVMIHTPGTETRSTPRYER